MAFEIAGYVLEPIRVGQSNATFTQTPDNYISDQGTFDAAYPTDESAPRADYMVLVTSEGDPRPGLLESARFGFTKNEVVARFTYDAQAGAFKPLRGAPAVEVGTLSVDANTTRLRVRPPVQAALVADAPFRLSVGSAGSGTTWSVVIVANDLGFGSPPAGTAELSMETGNLNWATADLSTFSGQRVRFQQQQFYELKDSTGNLGTPPIAISDPALILNPLPGPGQFPRLRFGHGFYLTPVEVPNEGAFTIPPVGTVQWAANTGRLRLNPTDASNHAGVPVYYDGVLFNPDMGLPVQSLGLISAPGVISGLPPLGVDLIFALTVASPYYRFPTVVYRAFASFTTSGKKGEVQVDPTTGQVKFSIADVTEFAGQSVDLYFGDLPIEHGITVRFLRNPVNLDASLELKDVTAIYRVEGATWADPIIQSPQVSLPSLPIEDPDPDYDVTVQVIQGQGSYVNDDFENLNGTSPPAGLGYYIDFDASTLFFAQRKEQLLVPIQSITSDVVLPDPLLLSSNLTLELETGPGTGIYTPLTIGDDVLVDTTAGVVSLASTNTLVLEGTASVSGLGVLTDSGAQFLTDGVQAGYLIVLANEDVYTVATVLTETTLQLDPVSPAASSVPYAIYENREILADRYFDPAVLLDPSTSVERILSLGAAANSPRLSVPLAYVESSGFRLGASQSDAFATVALVPNDGAFGSPAEGNVELSEDTGNLNFAAADLGTSIYWSRELTPGKDYELQPELGLVQFRDRMLSGEEARITYTVAPPSTIPQTLPGAPVTEYATFLIRKEITQPHPIPTSSLDFNVAGLPVALNPPPAVFRGGRPQKLGIQCVVDPVQSQIAFLPDSQITDALPHGATINPNERVYIDYYVTKAVGGEKTFTVLQPPILTSVVTINELDGDGQPNNQFVVHGDHTGTFQAGHLMRIETEQVYLIGSSSYDSGLQETTVVLYGNQVFQDPFSDPLIYVSSGPTPISAAPLVPAYFTSELQAFEPIARGSNTFLIAGDQTLSYRAGTVVMFTDSGSTFTDFLQVSGSAYEASTSRTSVMLSANAIRQYVSGQQLLLRSVRPVLEPPVTELQTSRVPKLTQPYVVFRRVAGESGQALVSPVDYTINESGHIVFAEPLGPNEEFSIFYTGLTTVDPGSGDPPINLRASYTCQIAPSATNGLLGQTLIADYSISSPDTFYYRVETMTNFRGEYAAEIATAASSGSSGPQTSNSSQPKLWEQGRKSLYFDENHLANQDIIARSTLLFYNDLANYLEGYRRDVDGTVVGNNDGELVFDGTTGTVRVPPDPPENQIDDTIKVSDAPYQITYPPYALTSIGTYRKYYLPGPLSRFYPTAKDFFGVTLDTSTADTGDEVLDTRSTNLTQVSNLRTRQAWAVLTEATQFSGKNFFGENTLKVDFANGLETGFAEQAETYARVPFVVGMKCAIVDHDGTVRNPPSSPVIITGVSAHQLTISGGIGGANAPLGATIYQSPSDDSGNLTSFVAGQDYSWHGEPGQVTYIGATTPPGDNEPLPALTAMSGSLTLNNTLTEPLQFPALFGGIEDDDGDLSFPIQTPDPASERDSYLATEKKMITTGTGLVRVRTTAPITSTGSVVAPNLSTIVDPAIGTGAMNPNQPQVHDLVRILTGTNGGSAFRRITSVTLGSLNVGAPYAASAGFTYELAVSPTLATNSGVVSGNTFQLTDTGALFLTTAKIGYTMVFPTTGHRRQIYEINSNITISFAPSLPFSVGPTTQYRIENSLATYGNHSGFGNELDYLQEWDEALGGEEALYPAEQVSLLAAIDQAFTDVMTGTAGQTTVGQNIFTDLSATFAADHVFAGHFVYIQVGSDAGIYEIQSVDSETQITTTTSFPATGASISYRIASLFGISGDSVKSLFTLYQSIAPLITPLAPLRAKLVQAPVVGFDFANTFALSILKSDLDTRETQVNTRLSAIVPIPPQIIDILANTDQVYDKRYVWIDTRINLEDGLLVRQQLAVKNRIKAQAEVVKQLTKLLAVEGA